MIRSSDEYEAIAVSNGESQGQPSGGSGSRQQETVGTTLGPVLDLEKGDAEFWLMVAQTVLLYLILREVRGRS